MKASFFWIIVCLLAALVVPRHHDHRRQVRRIRQDIVDTAVEAVTDVIENYEIVRPPIIDVDDTVQHIFNPRLVIFVDNRGQVVSTEYFPPELETLLNDPNFTEFAVMPVEVMTLLGDAPERPTAISSTAPPTTYSTALLAATPCSAHSTVFPATPSAVNSTVIVTVLPTRPSSAIFASVDIGEFWGTINHYT